MLQWEWLGGLPPLRRAAVIGAGSWGTARRGHARPRRHRGRPRLPHRASRPTLLARRAQQRALPARRRAARRASAVMRAAELELVAPRPRRLRRPRRASCPPRSPRTAAAIPPRTGVLVLSKGLVPPLGTLPVRLRRRARAAPGRSACSAAPPTPPTRSSDGASLVARLAPTAAFARQVADALAAAGFDVDAHHATSSASSSPAAPRTPPRSPPPPPRPPARTPPAPPPARCSPRSTRSRARYGSRPETFAGLAGAGDLVATVLADGSPQPPRRRAARRRACRPTTSAPRSARPPRRSTPSRCSPPRLQRGRRRRAGARGLAGLIEGRVEPERWTGVADRAQAGRPKARAKAA